MDVPEERNSEVLCEKFRSLVSGTFVGHRADVLFKQHDQDRDGRWCWSDFCRAVRTSAHVTDFAMRDDELRAVFNSHDDGVGLITFEQLQHLTVGSPQNSPHVSQHRRMKPPERKPSVAITQLRRALAAANQRVRELESTATQHAILTCAMRTWKATAATTRRTRGICILLSNLRCSNMINVSFTGWARICQWQDRASRVVATRQITRCYATVRSAFKRWVAWRESLAIDRLTGALKISRIGGQTHDFSITEGVKEATGDKNMQYQGNAVRARKQLQSRVEAAQQDAAESRKRADDLAQELKIMTVKLQKSEAAVVELNDLVAFSHYGGMDVEPQVQTGSSARGRAKTPSSSIQPAHTKAITQTKRPQVPPRTSPGRKPPASNPKNVLITLHTESTGQKLGLVLDKRTCAPCSIAKVTTGSLADKAQIKPGYSLIAVQGQSLEDCKYSEAISVIREASASQTRTLELIVRAPGVVPEDSCRSRIRSRTSSCGTRRSGNLQKRTNSRLKQNDGHQKFTSAYCPELPVQSMVDGVSNVDPRTPPATAKPRVKNSELSLSPITPMSAERQRPQQGFEAMDSDVDLCSSDRTAASADGHNSLTLQMIEPERADSTPRSASLRFGPATCWAEVVDPFSSLKVRGPEPCATSAKEALRFDDVREIKTPGAGDSDNVSAVGVQA